MTKANPVDLQISLEPHLVDALRPLPQIVPQDLAEKLRPHVGSAPTTTIPYSLLLAVSQWSRTTNGIATLKASLPPLDPQTYTMVSLLAGATTSPNGKFGEYIPAKKPWELEAERTQERKAITALVNSLLSIGGAAVATWWAAEKAGWRNEYRVLLSLFVAIVVSASESILYIIWQSRLSKRSKQTTKHRSMMSGRHKKDDGGEVLPDVAVSPPDREAVGGSLRLRRH